MIISLNTGPEIGESFNGETGLFVSWEMIC